MDRGLFLSARSAAQQTRMNQVNNGYWTLRPTPTGGTGTVLTIGPLLSEMSD